MRASFLPVSRLFVVLALPWLVSGVGALADDDGHGHRDGGAAASDRDRHGEHDDYDRLLDSVRKGKILPLDRLKAMILEKWPGEFVSVSVDAKGSTPIYEFRVLRSDGKLTEIEVDAADGRVIEVENE